MQTCICQTSSQVRTSIVKPVTWSRVLVVTRTRATSCTASAHRFQTRTCHHCKVVVSAAAILLLTWRRVRGFVRFVRLAWQQRCGRPVRVSLRCCLRRRSCTRCGCLRVCGRKLRGEA